MLQFPFRTLPIWKVLYAFYQSWLFRGCGYHYCHFSSIGVSRRNLDFQDGPFLERLPQEIWSFPPSDGLDQFFGSQTSWCVIRWAIFSVNEVPPVRRVSDREWSELCWQQTCGIVLQRWNYSLGRPCCWSRRTRQHYHTLILSPGTHEFSLSSQRWWPPAWSQRQDSMELLVTWSWPGGNPLNFTRLSFSYTSTVFIHSHLHLRSCAVTLT